MTGPAAVGAVSDDRGPRTATGRTGHRHWHGDENHVHERGDEKHRHRRDNGKTYFRFETREGVRVKCEGHWSVELGIADNWCYPKEGQ